VTAWSLHLEALQEKQIGVTISPRFSGESGGKVVGSNGLSNEYRWAMEQASLNNSQ